MRSLSLFVLIVACSKTSSGGDADAGTDSSITLDGAPLDVSLDFGPISACMQPVPAGFACPTPLARVGQKVCDDAAIDALVTCFVARDDAACAAAEMAHPACAACAKAWSDSGRLDEASCAAIVDGSGTCARALACNAPCTAAACATCSADAGEGSVVSERDDCLLAAQNAGGSCYALTGKDFLACAGDKGVARCLVFGEESARTFLRGACRDGGDWSVADKPTPDAGIDADAMDAMDATDADGS